MTSVSVTGSQSVISNNTISGDLTIKGSNNTITRNINLNIKSEGSFNNITENSNSAISLEGDFNIIDGNSFSEIHLLSADSNIVSNNTCHLLQVGTYKEDCSNNTSFGNTVRGPWTQWGILMAAGSNNIFYDNLVPGFGGSYYGFAVAIGSYVTVAENNLFYHNTFINNSKGVGLNWSFLGSGNFYDNGKEGNYWSDYDGIDFDGDGIGDTPYYTMYRENVDHYPFMNPLR